MERQLQKNSRASVSQGPVLKAILNITVPMVIVMAFNLVFAHLDLWYISRLGTQELHAMDVLFPYISLAGAIMYAGVGTGVSVVAARQGAPYHAIKAGLFLALPPAVLFAVGAAFGNSVLFRGIEMDSARLLAGVYSFWYFLFFPFMAFGSIIASAMRGIGHAVWPSVCSITCILVKAVLTPLFCFSLGMGFKGAAVAAATSFMLFFILMAKGLVRGSHCLCRSGHENSPPPGMYGDILRAGIMAVQTPLLASAILLVVLQVMSTRSTAMVDAFSLAKRFELYLIQMTVCLGCGMMPVMSSSRAAGNCRRVREALQAALKILMGIGIPVLICMVFCNRLFYNSLTSNPAIIGEGQKVFSWGAFNLLFTLGLILLNYGFQAIGYPFRMLPFLLFSFVLVQGGGSWLLRVEAIDSSFYYALTSMGSAAAFFMALSSLSRCIASVDTCKTVPWKSFAFCAVVRWTRSVSISLPILMGITTLISAGKMSGAARFPERRQGKVTDFT